MDLSVFDSTADNGEWLVLLDPITLEPTDAEILLSGEDSKNYRDAQKKILNRRLKQRNIQLTADVLEKEAELTLIAAVKDWKNISMGQEPLACTPENVAMLFAQPRFKWIKKKIDEFVSNEANFIKISEK